MATIARRNVIVEFNADTSQFNRAANQVEQEVTGLQRVFNNASGTFAGLFAFDIAGRLVSGIKELTTSSINLAIGAEQTQVAFETFLGSAEKATAVIAELNKFSEITPFEPEQVIRAGQSLLAFGVDADKVTESLEKIGNIAAGTGTDFNELSEIFGKAKVQGRLFGEDINQLTGRGIPIIGEFAKQFGVAESEVKKLVSEGKIGFPELEKAFDSLTGEGGKFFDLMNKQSQTVGGRISTLTGNFNALLRSIGQRLLPAVGELVDFFGNLVKTVKDFVDVPVSEKLEQERLALNGLVLAITDANTGEEERKRLIQELNAEYPDFLGNLNAETVSNEQLLGRLKEVNQQLINRIFIQQKEEELTKRQEQAAEAKAQREDAELKANTLLAKAARDLGVELDANNTTLEERVKQLNLSGSESAFLARAISEVNRLTDLEARLTKESLDLLKDKEVEAARLNVTLDKNTDATDKNNASNKRGTKLTKEQIKAIKEREKAFLDEIVKREKAGQKQREAQEKLEQEQFQKDIDRAAEEKKRQEEFFKDFQDLEDETATESERLAESRAANRRVLEELQVQEAEDAANKELLNAGNNAKEREKIEQELANEIRSIRIQSLRDQIALSDLSVEEKKRLNNELLKLEVEQQEDEEDQRPDPKEAAQKIVDATIEASQKILSALKDANEKRIALIDERIEKQEESVANALKIAEEGNVELLEREEERLNELEQKREEATRRQQRLAQIEIAINQAVAIANSVAAVAKAFNLPPPAGLITGVATSIALAGQVAAAIIAINSSFGNIGAFADGTEFFDGEGGPRSDSNLAFISRGERIVPADKNSKYFTTLNEFQKGTPVADMLHGIAQNGVPMVSQERQRAGRSYDFGRLESEMKGIRKLLSRGDTSVTLDKDGFNVHMQRYRKKKESLRKRLT